MSESNNIYSEASAEALLRLFSTPETPDSVLSEIERRLSQDLNCFLRERIVTLEKPLDQIEKDFSQSLIPEHPMTVSDHSETLMDKLVAHCVHTSSPAFIGHMTSALPTFLLPLSKLMVGLNQNVVKIETSKAFTPMERQVTAMIHRLAYGMDEAFYQHSMHHAEQALGVFCSGGTVANITALWIARNHAFKADGDFKGIGQSGLFAGLKHYGYEGIAILVSERGHYSLSKAADVLGIGRESLIAIECDDDNKIRVDLLAQKCRELQQQNIKVLAIVGVAGTTETGSVDPLAALADIAERHQIHFHVDAAWGGATLFSDRYRTLMAGIERADSITIDAHKQMYVPMGSGIVLFKNPAASAAAIEHHADYILRKGSKDLGSHTLEGSRPGMAMLLYSCLQIIGRQGYGLLIEQSIDKANYFAGLIEADEDFELISKPELCLLTYRYVPRAVQAVIHSCAPEQRYRLNELLNELTRQMQQKQRESGQSFVSRTRLMPGRYQRQDIIVFRVVLANPLTTPEIMQQVLQEQKQLAQQYQPLLAQLEQAAQPQ